MVVFYASVEYKITDMSLCFVVASENKDYMQRITDVIPPSLLEGKPIQESTISAIDALNTLLGTRDINQHANQHIILQMFVEDKKVSSDDKLYVMNLFTRLHQATLR